MSRIRFALGLITAFLSLSIVSLAFAEEVVVYSARKEHLIKPLFDAYTKETGVKVTFITDKAGVLVQKLKAEGKNTAADIFITVDAGNLWFAAKNGLLQPVESKVLQENSPPHLRDPQNLWFGLSVRARTIVYNTDKVMPLDLTTYEDLGNPKWKGRLCLRTSGKVYNQSMVAMFIAELGEEKTELVISAWVKNLAAAPFSNDTKVMKTIVAGQCDVGIVNTYYYGRLVKKDPSLPLALFWPNQDGSGVHVNVSGAGLTKYAKHKKEAIKLLEWFSTEKAQNLFADTNMEYPANPKVKPHPTVTGWGSFKQNMINVAKAGELQVTAVKLMDRVGYK